VLEKSQKQEEKWAIKGKAKLKANQEKREKIKEKKSQQTKID
jgi:hypothetical protein